MNSPLAILPCQSKAEWIKFERVAEDLHCAAPAFVPPFPGSVAKYLSPDSAFHKRHGTIHPFIATRGHRVVGRIAAIVKGHKEINPKPTDCPGDRFPLRWLRQKFGS